MLVNFEMFRELLDAPCQDRDLYFRRTSIGFMCASLFNDGRFIFSR